jgi:putative ABC transport system substrate-binding protein
VSSLHRPGANVTGIAALTIELDPKRFELLNELAPGKGPLGVLLNPARPDADAQRAAIMLAAQAIGREVVTARATTRLQIEPALATLADRSIEGLLVAADPFFSAERALVVRLVNHYKWPAIYQWKEFADAGGLASYGPNLADSYRQAALLAAKILNGAKSTDLPVQQPTKFEFVLNLQTAKASGIAVPIALLGRADAVIE